MSRLSFAQKRSSPCNCRRLTTWCICINNGPKRNRKHSSGRTCSLCSCSLCAPRAAVPSPRDMSTVQRARTSLARVSFGVVVWRRQVLRLRVVEVRKKRQLAETAITLMQRADAKVKKQQEAQESGNLLSFLPSSISKRLKLNFGRSWTQEDVNANVGVVGTSATDNPRTPVCCSPDFP